jgi:sulfide dehydrogenase cytochrome subunit
LSERYFIEVMQAYQYGGRFSTVMGRLALAYDDAEIRRMAKFFAQQRPRVQAQSVDLNQIDRGRRLHRQFCRDCHGDLVSLPEPDAVTLNGQWQPYLRWTLQDYLIGINRTSDGMSKAMSELIRQHGRAGLERLIHYYASARP